MRLNTVLSVAALVLSTQSALAQASRGQSEACQELAAFHLARRDAILARNAELLPRPTQTRANQLADLFLAELATAPDSPCSASLRRTLPELLHRAGRSGEILAVLEEGVVCEPRFSDRISFANKAVGFRKVHGGTTLSAEAEAACRSIALAALQGGPTLDEVLTDRDHGLLTTMLPLHNVVATTEPTDPERLAALRRLIAFCVEANVVFAASQTASRMDFDLDCLASNAMTILLRAQPTPSPEEFLEIARALPLNGSHELKSFLTTLIGANAIPRATKLAILDGCEATATAGLLLQHRYQLVYPPTQSLGSTSSPEVLNASLAELDDLWARLVAAEATRPAPQWPEGIDQSGWRLMVKRTLEARCVLGLKYLENPAYCAAVAEFLARFPNESAVVESLSRTHRTP